jgi:hypothetical protein
MPVVVDVDPLDSLSVTELVEDISVPPAVGR